MISRKVLVLAEGFDERIDAERVSRALARGLEAEGRLDCDLCPLEQPSSGSATTRAPVVCTTRATHSTALDEVGFDARLLAARALVIACERLGDRTLAGTLAFEAATRARQSGVPAYAVTARDELDPFEARILDLQVVLVARTTRALRAAGVELAKLA